MSAAPEEAHAEKKPAGAGLLAGVAGVGLVLGGAVGVFVIGPKMVKPPAGAEAEKKQHEEAEAKKKAEEKPGHVVRLDNIVVNPAGTDGSRYLMVSVAFEVEVKDPKEAEKFKEKEVQLKDEVVTLLARQTLADLTKPTARAELKEKLGEAIAPVIGAKEAPKVFLPQFVIQ